MQRVRKSCWVWYIPFRGWTSLRKSGIVKLLETIWNGHHNLCLFVKLNKITQIISTQNSGENNGWLPWTAVSSRCRKEQGIDTSVNDHWRRLNFSGKTCCQEIHQIINYKGCLFSITITQSYFSDFLLPLIELIGVKWWFVTWAYQQQKAQSDDLPLGEICPLCTKAKLAPSRLNTTQTIYSETK